MGEFRRLEGFPESYEGQQAARILYDELYTKEEPLTFPPEGMLEEVQIWPRDTYYGVFVDEHGPLAAAGLLEPHIGEGEPAYHIDLVAVDPPYQGQGYGREIVEGMEGCAAGDNASIIRTFPATDNARSFFAHLGYNPTHDDNVYYEKHLPHNPGAGI